ncbi:hypothetical protein BG015_003662, partial [Linnemannia schmuckeri]
RIRRQFPSVPQGNTYLLLETALEAMAYKTAVTGTKKSKPTARTGSGPCRDSSTSAPLPNLNYADDTDTEMKETVTTTNNDHHNDDDALEPLSTQQKQQQWEERGARGGKVTNEMLQQQEEANDDHVEGYYDMPREPNGEQLLFIPSNNNNSDNNGNSNNKNEQSAAATPALVPDCSISHNSPRNFGVDETDEQCADLALNPHYQQPRQKQQRLDDYQCLEIDLEMDEWRRREQGKQNEQSDFSDFGDFSEEEEEQQQQQFEDEEDESGLVEQDEGMWGE